MSENEMVYRTVYVHTDVWQRIVRQAEKEQRTVNNLVTVLLSQAIETRELQMELFKSPTPQAA